MYAKILVPIDGSDAAERGLVEAIGLAQAFGSTICLVHVVTESLSLGVPANMRVVELENTIEAMRRNGERLLARARESVLAEGVLAVTRLIEAWGGSAGKHIVELAKEWRPDLIVCGRCGVDRLLMGSSATYIVRHSPARVLLVPPGVGAYERIRRQDVKAHTELAQGLIRGVDARTSDPIERSP